MADIGQVIEALKEGKHARRAGWNGKRMHIYMEDAHNAGGGGMRRKYESHLVLFTAQQTHQPGWNASTPDLLSTDWEILEPHETDYPRQAASNPQDLDSSCGD